MFKRYQFREDYKRPRGSYIWTVEDDDFQDSTNGYISIYEAVMTIYSARNLPVAPNVIRLLLYMEATKMTNLKEAVAYSRAHNPLHKLYEVDIDKLLALM